MNNGNKSKYSRESGRSEGPESSFLVGFACVQRCISTPLSMFAYCFIEVPPMAIGASNQPDFCPLSPRISPFRPQTAPQTSNLPSWLILRQFAFSIEIHSWIQLYLLTIFDTLRFTQICCSVVYIENKGKFCSLSLSYTIACHNPNLF